MSTSATFSYLVVVQNLGNVYDKYSLYTDINNNEYASCTNPDGTSSSGESKITGIRYLEHEWQSIDCYSMDSSRTALFILS